MRLFIMHAGVTLLLFFTSAAVISILCCCIRLGHAAEVASCQNQYKMEFKDYSEPGDVSFVTRDTTLLPVYPFVNIPIIILNVRFLSNAIDLTLDGTLVQAVASPLLRLGGDTVQLTQGQAIFRALQVQQLPSDTASQTYVIQFKIVLPYGSTTQTLVVSSPPLYFTATTANLPLSLQFGNYGFFYRANATVEYVPMNTPLPLFTLRLVDQLGYFAAQSSANISVRYGSGNIAGVSVSPSTFLLSSGTLDIRNLVIVSSSARPPAAPLVFFAGVDGTTLRLSTGSLSLVDPASTTTCSNIDFDPSKSFFRYNNIGNTAVLGTVIPPIVINCLGAGRLVDEGATGAVVIATAAGAVLEGGAALVLSGVARFSDLKFTQFSPVSAVITFSASLSVSNNQSVARRVVSGAVTVSTAPIKARHLVFAPGSSIFEEKNTPGGKSAARADATVGRITLPFVSVAVLDSAYQSDYTAAGIHLQLSVIYDGSGRAPVFTDGPQTMSTVGGFATIRALSITVYPENIGSTFVIRLTDLSGIRPTLDSAPILLISFSVLTTALVACYNGSAVSSLSSCGLTTSFVEAPYSHVTRSGETLSMTVGSSVPEVRVYLADADGPVVSASFPTATASLYVFTESHPSTERFLETGGSGQPSLRGVWQGGYFSFSCLQLKSAPTQLVRLHFAFFYQNPTTNALVQVLGIPLLRTGFLSVAADTTGNFGIRFAKSSNSFFQYAGQSATAVVNVAMPQIQIEIVDSLGNVDTSGSGITLAVTASGGGLFVDGGIATFVNGVATLSTLRFTTRADGVVVTFTVQQSAKYPLLSGKTLSSGIVSVSALPVPAVRLGMIAATSCAAGFVCPSHPHQAFTFATIADVKINVTLTIFDNTNQPTFVDDGTMIGVAQESSEADIAFGSTTGQMVVPIGKPFAIQTTLNGWSATHGPSSAPMYIRYRVIHSPAYPGLVGSQVVVGPLTVGVASAAANCPGAAAAPVVVLKLYEQLSTVQAAQWTTTFLRRIAYLMGVEPSRITLVGLPSTTAGVRVDTSRWVGTRIAVQFTDPTPSSSNRDSAAALASSLVSLRPDCDAPELGIASVFLLKDEKSCVAADFNLAVADATRCSVTGFFTTCQCYQDNVISKMGIACSIDVNIKTSFSDMCQQLADCPQSEIISVCSEALNSRGGWWLWVIVGVLSFLCFAGVVYFVLKKIVLRPSAVRLNKE